MLELRVLVNELLTSRTVLISLVSYLQSVLSSVPSFTCLNHTFSQWARRGGSFLLVLRVFLLLSCSDVKGKTRGCYCKWRWWFPFPVFFSDNVSLIIEVRFVHDTYFSASLNISVRAAVHASIIVKTVYDILCKVLRIVKIIKSWADINISSSTVHCLFDDFFYSVVQRVRIVLLLWWHRYWEAYVHYLETYRSILVSSTFFIPQHGGVDHSLQLRVR